MQRKPVIQFECIFLDIHVCKYCDILDKFASGILIQHLRTHLKIYIYIRLPVMFCRNTTLHHRVVSIMKADIAASALKKRYNVTRNVWHIHLCNFIHQIFSLFSSWEKSECLLYGYTT